MQVTATLIVERAGKGIELTIEGTYNPGVSGASWEVDPDDLEIENTLLDEEPWEGELTDDESASAMEALIAAAQGLGGPEDDGEDDDDFRPLTLEDDDS